MMEMSFSLCSVGNHCPGMMISTLILWRKVLRELIHVGVVHVWYVSVVAVCSIGVVSPESICSYWRVALASFPVSSSFRSEPIRS